jgi:hypothetical protein
VAAPAFLLDVHLHKNENFLPSPGINMQLVWWRGCSNWFNTNHAETVFCWHGISSNISVDGHINMNDLQTDLWEWTKDLKELMRLT